MLRTNEQLQLLFSKSKEEQKRKKEKQLLKYRKAQESTKKELLKKKKKENKIQPPTKTKKYNIYNSPTIERETPENKLYSLFELQHIEELYPDEEGRICWTKWNELIQNFKNL